MPPKRFFQFSSRNGSHRPRVGFDRILAVQIIILIATGIITVRLFSLQVLGYEDYRMSAEQIHSYSKKILPKRGEVFLKDRTTTFPAIMNREYTLVYAVPKYVPDPLKAAEALAPILEMEKELLLEKLSKKNDVYEILKKKVPEEKINQIKSLELIGIHFETEQLRYYPEPGFGGHVMGFLGYEGSTLKGRYGIEGYFDSLLRGKNGSVKLEKDPIGALIPVGNQENIDPVHGSKIILTLERSLQLTVCDELKKWVLQHGADGGSVIIMEPYSGKILAICSTPDFDSNDYAKAEVSSYSNPALYDVYEPGSIFKPITMAIGLDLGKITPTTTYEDTGKVVIGSYTIKNSDGKKHGKQTMTQVLEESLNTGTIFVARKIERKNFLDYLKNFGFGIKTGIELGPEAKGDISSLRDKRDIYLATASFGQGISVTPLQIVVAFAALANGGNLVQPTIIEEIIHSDGRQEKTNPKIVRRVISESASSLISGMLVNVVRNGHGKKAGVPLYYIAGKTGTAQVPRKDKKGYESGATIGSFIGYGPVGHPRFVMLVKIDRPRDVQWAESSAAPLFGTLAKFLLQYYEVPPDEKPEEVKK